MKPLIELTASIIDDNHTTYIYKLTSLSNVLPGTRIGLCDNDSDNLDLRLDDSILTGVVGIAA